MGKGLNPGFGLNNGCSHEILMLSTLVKLTIDEIVKLESFNLLSNYRINAHHTYQI